MSWRWTGLWQRLGAGRIPAVDPVLARWGEPHRHYHGVSHLRHCLATYDRNPQRDDRVELALWLHDAIHDPQAKDNEARSADLARELAGDAGLDAAVTAVVVACILATRHRAEPTTAAEALTVDVDLAILGETRRRFARYDAAIRVEYAWVPEPDYRSGRSAVLSGFLERPRLYRTPWFRRRYEARARRNLAWAITRLTASH